MFFNFQITLAKLHCNTTICFQNFVFISSPVLQEITDKSYKTKSFVLSGKAKNNR